MGQSTQHQQKFFSKSMAPGKEFEPLRAKGSPSAMRSKRLIYVFLAETLAGENDE
jgi:hypothetical protein